MKLIKKVSKNNNYIKTYKIINMNGLSGYYADVMFENDSKKKAELFSISSEISESSK